MARKAIAPSDRVKFSENSDGTYDLFVNGRIWAYDTDAEEFGRTLKRFKVSLPVLVRVEDLTGHEHRARVG